MSSLRDELMNTFHSDKFKGLGKTEAAVQIIAFLSDSLVELGHARHRIFVSGYLGEVMSAHDHGMTLNESAQGVDGWDANGESAEIKVSYAKLGDKANVNLVVPVPLKGEVESVYYERLAKINKEKGTVRITHRYHPDDVEIANEYAFSHRFISFYMEMKECYGKDNVNIGGASCKTCTRIHRLDALKECEIVFLTHGIAAALKAMPDTVASQCPAVEDKKGHDEQEAPVQKQKTKKDAKK